MVSWDGEPFDDGVLADWWVPRQLDSVPDVRRQVRMLAWSIFSAADRAREVELCVTEVLTNAVRHGKGDEVRVFVCVDDDGLTVEVTDDGSGGIPQRQPAEIDSGRGLLIVSGLADRWSYALDPDTGQLSVSFDFDIAPEGDP